MYQINVKEHFDAAHYIRDYEGSCSRLHGHRWEVEASYIGQDLDSRNILVDFKDVKGILKGVLEQFLDHYLLNETLNEPNLTAEYLAKWLYYNLKSCGTGLLYNSSGVDLVSVTIWESLECSITFSEEVK